ncbi:MAG: hypothetical protein ACLPKB_17035 [Xanthobacteraceae bacterium]
MQGMVGGLPPRWGQMLMIGVRENSDPPVSALDRIVAASVFRAMRQTDANLALYERQYGSSDRPRYRVERMPKEKQ